MISQPCKGFQSLLAALDIQKNFRVYCGAAGANFLLIHRLFIKVRKIPPAKTFTYYIFCAFMYIILKAHFWVQLE